MDDKKSKTVSASSASKSAVLKKKIQKENTHAADESIQQQDTDDNNRRSKSSRIDNPATKQQESEANTSEKDHESSTRAAMKASLRSNSGKTPSAAQEEAEEDDRAWVQCNHCDKWRALAKHVDPSKLPEVWYCKLNTWDPDRMSCDAPEESYDEEQIPLRSFCKLWAKKLKNADRVETRLPPSAVTRGRKRKLDMDWIRCSNAACGKWRAIPVRGLDTIAMLKRLNTRGKWGAKSTVWYCSMNSWDETTASCAAPQESLIDAPWSLGITES